MKKPFLSEKISKCSSAHIISYFEKTAGVLWPKLRQKNLRFRERNWGRKKTRTLSSTSWMHFAKLCWNLLLKPGAFNRTFRKKAFNSGGKVRKWTLHKKKIECRFLSENFALSRKVSCSKHKINKLFRLGRNATLFLCSRFLQFWDQCQFFKPNSEKNLFGIREIWYFLRKKPTRTTYWTSWFYFQNHGRNVFDRCRNIHSHSPKRHVILLGKRSTKCPLHKEKEILKIFSEKFFSKSEIFPLNLPQWKRKILKNQEKTSTLSSSSSRHFRKLCWKLVCRSYNI